MASAIQDYLSGDHRRIEEALQRACCGAVEVDGGAYWEFRGMLLRHIGMEEKILLPAARTARGGQPLPLAEKLRRDHSALAALLVLPPTTSIIETIRTILSAHNLLEEGLDGVYMQCDQIPGLNAAEMIDRLRRAPAVAMAPYSSTPVAVESARSALRRAGYDAAFEPNGERC
jgi:hypothetical protein